MYHTFLHHSQTTRRMILLFFKLVYHTFLHHSQTISDNMTPLNSLCTIHFYIILKQHFIPHRLYLACVPYIFTSFSNTSENATSHHKACVPYIFTSFSNWLTNDSGINALVYHTFLHHSQTRRTISRKIIGLVYHTFLHHSQTYRRELLWGSQACVPYIFTSFSNEQNLFIASVCACVPYIFTSFSNPSGHFCNDGYACVPYIFTSFSNLCL